MALTPSNMLPLGTLAPDFKLPDTDGNFVTLNHFPKPKGYLVMFICNHCPYVVHLKKHLAQTTSEFINQGIAVFGINSNDVANYPEDHPDKMKLDKNSFHYSFPYLFDESQAVAKAYQAACTPDFFLFDANKKLVYRGQYDKSRPKNQEPITGEDLKNAVRSVVEEKSLNIEQIPSIGCNIKWK